MNSAPSEKVYFQVLYPSEVLVVFASALTALLYLALGVPFRDPLGFYFQQLKIIPIAYPFGLFVALICLLGIDGYRKKQAGEISSEREVWISFRKQYIGVGSVLRDLRLLNVVMITFVLFGHLKNLIPVVNSTLWDQQLLDMERALFGGKVAFEIFDSFIPRSWAGAISAGYEAYYVYFSLALFIFVLQRKNRLLAEEFCFAFCFIWILGVVVTYVLPTWGPCFFAPELYESLPDTTMRFMQADLWQMKALLETDRSTPGAVYAISGLPSMHFAVVLLGSVYLQRLNRLLSILSWLFVAVTFVSTLYFGWHYLLDDVASVALVWVVVYVVRRFYSSIEATP
jgi:membrane-associated phospholipid phosphatase